MEKRKVERKIGECEVCGQKHTELFPVNRSSKVCQWVCGWCFSRF